MAKRYPTEQRELATRMALDRLGEYRSAWAAAQVLGPKLGVGAETLRKWVLQAQVDAGDRSGPTSEELEEIRRLRGEVRDLKEANDRLMRTEGLRGLVRGRGVRTTTPAKTDARRAGDLLNRRFTAAAPNLAWVTDFTYVAAWAGFVYVAFAVDLFSRAIVGWSAATVKDVAFVEACLAMALWRRDHTGRPVGPGMIHHSDAGSQPSTPRSGSPKPLRWKGFPRRSGRSATPTTTPSPSR